MAINWRSHYQAYHEALASEPELSMAKYAQRHGLNINSIRARFGTISREDEAGKQAIKGDRSKNKKNDRSREVKPKNKNIKSIKSNSYNTISKVEAAASAAGAAPEKNEFKKRGSVIDHQDRVGGRFKAGNDQAVTFGRYMSMAKVDSDIVEAVNLIIEDDLGLLKLSSARYLMMNRNLHLKHQEIIENYENNTPYLDENNNPIPRDSVIAKLLVAASPVFSDAERTINMLRRDAIKNQTERLKQVQMDENLHPLNKKEQLKRMREIIQNRKETDSAVNIVTTLELEGLKVPAVLLAEAMKEIEERKPIIEDVPVVTEAEMEANARAYAKSLDYWQGDFIAQRMQEIDAINMSADGRADELNGDDFGQGDWDNDAILPVTDVSLPR